jgi:orotate phosphoribosyltransferase
MVERVGLFGFLRAREVDPSPDRAAKFRQPEPGRCPPRHGRGIAFAVGGATTLARPAERRGKCRMTRGHMRLDRPPVAWQPVTGWGFRCRHRVRANPCRHARLTRQDYPTKTIGYTRYTATLRSGSDPCASMRPMTMVKPATNMIGHNTNGMVPSKPLDDLFTIISTKAYREGDFTLSSGRKSSHYFDGKKVLFDQQGSRLFADWLIHQMRNLGTPPTAIGGLEIGAIPIACTTMALASFPLKSFVVRKQPKKHGTGNLVEGDLVSTDRVAVVDDVITTGESTMKAIRAVQETGAEIVAIYCLVDRQEGHSAEFDTYARLFHPAFTLEEFTQRRREHR